MLRAVMQQIRKTGRKRGQALVEYGVVLAFIGLALIFALTSLGHSLVGFFNSFTAYITSICT